MNDFIKIKGYESFIRVSAIVAVQDRSGNAEILLAGGNWVKTEATVKEVMEQIKGGAPAKV